MSSPSAETATVVVLVALSLAGVRSESADDTAVNMTWWTLKRRVAFVPTVNGGS